MGDLDKILEDLLAYKAKLDAEIESSGAGERYRTIVKQIKEIGWDQLMVFYHPENNYKDPAANELYAFYKFVYEDMKKKGEV
jgi:hypothetical protein